MPRTGEGGAALSGGVPVRLAGREVFARVRERFRALGFDDAAVNGQMSREPRLMSHYMGGELVSGMHASETLTRVFFGGTVGREEFRSMAGSGTMEDLRTLGLVEDCEGDRVRATVRLRPMVGLYVITDLDRRFRERQSDFVYPPDGPNTHEYLAHLPGRFEGDFLEGCGGSGVAALVAASRGARHAWSFDISGRCSQFAEFSARLSGVDNFTAATGDTFEPAEERQFDRIALHPPYVPVLREQFVFSDGGGDGEAITRKHVEAAPAHLKPGGRLSCRCMLSDRAGAPVEARLREWLGKGESEFDVALHVIRYITPHRLLLEMMAEQGAGSRVGEDVGPWMAMVEALRIERFVLCGFVLQRHAAKRETFTVRREMGAMSRPEHLEWLMNWQTLYAGGRAAQVVLEGRLKGARTMLEVGHKMDGDGWGVVGQRLEVGWPYPLVREVDDLAAYLVPRLDGSRTGRDLFVSLHAGEADAPRAGSAEETRFGLYLAELVGLGVLLVEGYEPLG